jgi:hypothetical protein
MVLAQLRRKRHEPAVHPHEPVAGEGVDGVGVELRELPLLGRNES